jgi:hypothetical protein
MPSDDDPRPLTPGFYEEVDRGLERGIEGVRSRGGHAETEPVDEGDGPAVLANHLRRLTRAALEGLAGDDRLEGQARLCD